MRFRLGDRVQLARACLFLAGANLAQHRLRLIVALGGIGVALLLLEIQIAFLDAARAKVTALYDDFGFDIAMVDRSYQFLDEAGTFDRIRLSEARGAAPVADTFALNVSHIIWTNLATKRRSTALLIGLDDKPDFIADRDLRAGLARLKDSRSVLVDRFSAPDFGAVGVGAKAKLGTTEVTVAGQFALGLFFYADGGVAVTNADFVRLDGRPARKASIGFIRLAPGADAGEAMARIAAALPTDVHLYLRQDLIDQERAFFISAKPIGIMLRIGMVIAVLVATVIVFQVLSAEIINRVREFATLKALGFGPAFVYGVGALEAAMLGVGGFVPAAVAGAAVLRFVEHATHLATALSPAVAGAVIAVALVIAAASSAAVLRRVRRADPAELY